MFLILMDYFKNQTLRDRCLQKTTAYEIVTVLFDQINGFQTSDVYPEDQKADEDKLLILDYLVNDVHCPLYIISEKLGYSVRHTARLIQQVYGKNLVELRQNEMLVSAKQLLIQHPKLSLENVAYKSGFPDVEAMQKTFMKLENCTPSEYRKQNEKSGE